MKKFLFLVLFACLSLPVMAFQDIVIPSELRATGVTVFSADILGEPSHRGIQVNTKVTAVSGGVDTPNITLTIQGKTPTGDYYDILSSTAVAVAVGTVTVLRVGPGITVTANQSAAEAIPAVYRIRAVTGSTGSSTFSVGLSAN